MNLKGKKNRKRKNDQVNSEHDLTFFPPPREIDTHYQLYGKYIWQVKYPGKCQICNGMIDEFGLCACGSVND